MPKCNNNSSITDIELSIPDRKNIQHKQVPRFPSQEEEDNEIKTESVLDQFPNEENPKSSIDFDRNNNKEILRFNGPYQISGRRFKFSYQLSSLADAKECLIDQERNLAADKQSSLLYGELSVEGVTKIFDQFHLDV